MCVLVVLLVSSCSVSEPFQDFDLDEDGSPGDSTRVESPLDTLNVIPPPDSITYPAHPLPTVKFRNLSSVDTSYTFTPDTLFAGPYADVDVYRNAERVRWPFRQGRWLRSGSEHSIVEVSVDCSELPFLDLRSLFLLQVPDSVDVDQWMRYKNADFGNEYTSIQADTILAVGALAEAPSSLFTYRLINQHTNPRYIFELRYALSISQLLFDNGTGIEQLEMEAHECYPGDGWGEDPPGEL